MPGLPIEVWLSCVVATFTIGLMGIVLNRKNILSVLFSIEIVFLSINLNFGIISVYSDDVIGQAFVVFILSVAAAESAIALSIITVFYRLKQNTTLPLIKQKTKL